jgi:hypothetical protein
MFSDRLQDSRPQREHRLSIILTSLDGPSPWETLRF